MSRPTPPTYKTRNWPAYNEALKRRGSLTIWFDPAMIWEAAPTGKRGRRRDYSDAAIQTCLTMKVLFGMALRQTTGFVESLLRLIGLDWAVPDFSTLSRRQKTLKVNIPYRGSDGPLHRISLSGERGTPALSRFVQQSPDGRQLACRQLTDYTGDKVRTLYPNASELRTDWLDPERRAEIVERLEEKGIDLDSLADAVGKPEADPFDLLCHLAYNAPLRTRRERADRLLGEQDEFLARFGPDAREVLDAVLEKYAEHGSAQFKLPDILEVPPFNEWGNVIEIAARFGGGGKFTALPEWLQASEAWTTMKPGPRALYIELKRRFNGSNNGEIYLSHRDAAKALNVNRDTASGYFDELEGRGFIRLTVGPHLGPSGVGQASKWAIEEEPTPDGKPAGKAFMRWTNKQNPRGKIGTLRPKNWDACGIVEPATGEAVPKNGTHAPDTVKSASQKTGHIYI